MGNDVYAGEYWFQGAKIVDYQELTLEPGSFLVAGVPDGSADASASYANTTANERHYWSLRPTNETVQYNTTFKVWGNFTTYTTHLSNHMATLTCHTSAGGCDDGQNVTSHSAGRFEAANIMQCPFQFRCFNPESVAGRPGCHRNFPEDYTSVEDISTGLHPRKC